MDIKKLPSQIEIVLQVLSVLMLLQKKRHPHYSWLPA